MAGSAASQMASAGPTASWALDVLASIFQNDRIGQLSTTFPQAAAFPAACLSCNVFACKEIRSPATFVAGWERNSVLAITASGKVFVIDAEGRLAGCEDLGTKVTAVLRPGDHRNARSILAGTADGRVLVLRLPRRQQNRPPAETEELP